MSPAQRNRLRNSIHSLLMLCGMFLLLLILGTSLFGAGGAIVMLISGMIATLLSPRASAWLTLKLNHAQRLDPHDTPSLHEMVQELAKKAQLAESPTLFLMPGNAPNSFAMQDHGHPLIALTDSLLHQLDMRQIRAVLAHETSHIRNGDLDVMMTADLLSRMTAALSNIGWLMLIILMPVCLLYGLALPWLSILLLVLAPTLSTLMQLALSRTREFNADLGAAELTHDPEGLALALACMEQGNRAWWQPLLADRRQTGGPSILRTHPDTADRIRRLHKIAYAMQAHQYL